MTASSICKYQLVLIPTEAFGTLSLSVIMLLCHTAYGMQSGISLYILGQCAARAPHQRISRCMAAGGGRLNPCNFTTFYIMSMAMLTLRPKKALGQTMQNHQPYRYVGTHLAATGPCTGAQHADVTQKLGVQDATTSPHGMKKRSFETSPVAAQSSHSQTYKA